MELEDYLVGASDGPYQEYFYLDLPAEEMNPTNDTSATSTIMNRQRYVYVRSDSQQRFPMSLGNEVSLVFLYFYSSCYDKPVL